jgi:hypothetical protein
MTQLLHIEDQVKSSPWIWRLTSGSYTNEYGKGISTDFLPPWGKNDKNLYGIPGENSTKSVFGYQLVFDGSGSDSLSFHNNGRLGVSGKITFNSSNSSSFINNDTLRLNAGRLDTGGSQFVHTDVNGLATTHQWINQNTGTIEGNTYSTRQKSFPFTNDFQFISGKFLNQGNFNLDKYDSVEIGRNGGYYFTNEGNISIESLRLGWNPKAKSGSENPNLRVYPGSTLENNQVISNQGAIIIDEGGTYKGNAISPGKGVFINNGTLAPGNSAGGMFFEGDLTFSETSTKEVELGGSDTFGFDRNNTLHDFIEVEGDLLINGGELEVSLIDGHKLSRGQEYLIAKIDGDLSGRFDGLKEGDLVGKFESIYGDKIDLRISYASGDGNDISLYTDPMTYVDMILGMGDC